MRARLRIGDGLAYLQRKAAAGHAGAQAELAAIPPPPSPLLWAAFWHLNAERGRTPLGDLAPLSAVQIEAHARLNGFATDLARRRLVNAIRAMDRTYLEFLSGNTRP